MQFTFVYRTTFKYLDEGFKFMKKQIHSVVFLILWYVNASIIIFEYISAVYVFLIKQLQTNSQDNQYGSRDGRQML